MRVFNCSVGKILHSEKGSALITVLMLLVVLMVLTTGFLFTMNTEARQSVRHADKTQAYYYARSGAEAASEWLIDEGSDFFDDYNGEAYIHGDFLKLQKGIPDNETENIEVSIEEKDDDKVIITSTGRYNDTEEQVVLEFERTNAGGGPFIGIDTENKVWSFVDGEWNQLSNQPERKQNQNLNAMAWSGSELVVLGDNHAVSILKDLNEDWLDHRETGGGGPQFREVIWADGKESFFAITHHGRIYEREEADEINDWDELPENFTTYFSNEKNVSAAYGEDTLVATTGNGAIYYYDFNEDESREIDDDFGGSEYLYDVAYGDGVFVAVGSDYYEEGVIYSSDNGKDWSEEVRSEDIECFGTITWCGDYFFTAKGEGLGYAYSIKKSSDGKSWEDTGEWDNGWDLDWNNIVKVNDTILVTSPESSIDGGDHGAYVISYDGGETWEFNEHEDVPKIKRLISTDEDIGGFEFKGPTWH